jgi:hypothetical protein
MGALFLLILLGAIASSSNDAADQDRRAGRRRHDQFIPEGDFVPTDAEPAARNGAPCWICGRRNDGHRHQ